MSNSHDEFKELHRKYQHLEQNRKDYAKESAQTVARQQKLVDKLRKDNEYLKNEYRNQMRKPRDSSSQAKLMELHDQVDTFTAKINLEKKNVGDYTHRTKVMKRKILQVRKDMGGINAARENQLMVQKQINILENRLDKALVKFNNALAENKHLRKKIDNLRQERIVFDNIYRKLERELHQKKMHMAEIIEQSNQAYEARDKAHVEIASIHAQNEREQETHDKQITALDRMHDEMKAKKRAHGTHTQEGKSTSGEIRGSLSIEEESKLKAKTIKSAWVVVKEKSNLGQCTERVETYEGAFEKIKAVTGITDINELVKTFIESEDQNFSLFNYVNGQAHEIEKHEEEYAALEAEERKYAAADGQDADQHKLLQNELQQKLEYCKSTAEKYEMKFKSTMKTLASLKLGIQAIFNKAGCDKSTMSEMLHGERLQVTEGNMMQYLGMIEQRTNEILQQWAVSQSTTNNEGGQQSDTKSSTQAIMQVLGQGPTHPMGEQKIQIAPPTMDDYSDNDDDDSDGDDVQMPHNLDQIKNEVMQFMSQRSNKNHSKPKHFSDSLGAHHAGNQKLLSASDAKPSGGRRSRFRRAF